MICNTQNAKYGKDVVIPDMEPTGHYWFTLGKFLQDNGMKPVHENPYHARKSKEMDDDNPNENEHNKERAVKSQRFS